MHLKNGLHPKAKHWNFQNPFVQISLKICGAFQDNIIFMVHIHFKVQNKTFEFWSPHAHAHGGAQCIYKLEKYWFPTQFSI